MTALRERLADKSRYDDWRKLERVREIDREEDQAKAFARQIRSLRGEIANHIGRDVTVAERDWQDVLELLDDAAKTADSIVGACRNASDDAAREG
jgi:hypothetical protein